MNKKPDNALAEKLRSELLPASWSMLKEHCERQALILVAQELDLISVAVAVANDDSASVSQWLQDGQLTKVEADSVMATEFASGDEQATLGEFLIVQPFVLLQRTSLN